MEGQSTGLKNLITLELQRTKTLHGMSNIRTSTVKLKIPFAPKEIKEYTTANRAESGVQGIARESFEIQ